MENIVNLLKYPIVIGFIYFIVFIIKHYDKIRLIIPNNQRLLEKYIDLKKMGCENKVLDCFVTNKVEKLKFSIATGLKMDERNTKLLNLYNLVANEFEWARFLKIKEYIVDLDELKAIPLMKVKAKINFKLIGWGLLFILGLVMFVYFLNIYQGMLLSGKVYKLILPTFLFSFSEIN